MTLQEQNAKEYQELQYEFLKEAEEMFGPKTVYSYSGLTYHNFAPRTVLCDSSFLSGEHTFKIQLHGKAINNRTDGIFQLSHEVVHLLSPIVQEDGNEVNYLEEGMATYFSKLITERMTQDYEFCEKALEKHPKYLRACSLYLALIKVDAEAIKKLRSINPIISQIQPKDFETAGISIDQELMDALLEKF